MQFDKTSFFKYFNTPKKTYSESEIRYQIEVIARVKKACDQVEDKKPVLTIK